MVKKWEIAIDLLKEVYGTLQMFAFILEESCQSIGMAVFISYKAKNYDRTKELANYAITEIIDPALDWIAKYGYLIWPNNIAYKEFFLASKKSMERYIELCP